MSTTPESEATRDAVRQHYAGIARETMAETTEASATSCCTPAAAGANPSTSRPWRPASAIPLKN